MSLCKCGCGVEVRPGKQYVRGHNSRGRTLSDEHRNNIRRGLTGRHHTMDALERMSGTNHHMYGRIGEKSPNWKERIKLICEYCGNVFEPRPSRQETAKFCSPECARAGHGANMRGLTGDKSVAWNGGRSTERQIWGYKYGRDWRKSVFERDDYTCQECGKIGRYLNAHHILPYRDWKDFQYASNIMNGITLCEKCHRKTFGKEYEFFNKYFDIANGIRSML